jgi:hypothetical protein
MAEKRGRDVQNYVVDCIGGTQEPGSFTSFRVTRAARRYAVEPQNAKGFSSEAEALS